MRAKNWVLRAAVSLFCIQSVCQDKPANSSHCSQSDAHHTCGLNYTAWGDSLTSGCEDGTSPECSYPYQLGQLIESSVVNEGIGGQTSTQIAVRMGAVATNVVNAFTIPKSGSVSNVTFKPGYEPCIHVGGPGLVEGKIDGVHVYCQDAGDGFYTLTRVTAGSARDVNSGDEWIPVLPTGTLSGMNIIWAGRNNTSLCPYYGSITTDNCPVARDITSMTALVQEKGGKFLILTVINGELDGFPGESEAYDEIINIDQWITSTYSSNSLDIRAALVAAYDASNLIDVVDHMNDIPPFSLRALDNSGKLAADVNTTTTCAISMGRNLDSNVIVNIGFEYIYIHSGVDGNYNCTRGYGGSTAVTYSSGTPWVGADSLHLSGYGTANTSNPNGPGYTFVARAVQAALAKQQ